MRAWIGLALLPALAACATTPPALPKQPLDVEIDVVQRDWHTDLCLDPHDLSGNLAKLAATLPGARSLCFGFGERQYMMEKDHSTAAMLMSLLPSRAVVLVTPLPGPPATAIDPRLGPFEIVPLHISHAGAANFSAVVWSTFATNPDGSPALLGPASDPGSRFYAASGTYNAMTTCNTFTATGLRQAGLPINDGVVFVDDLMAQVRKVARLQQAGM